LEQDAAGAEKKPAAAKPLGTVFTSELENGDCLRMENE
jgi:hypothetical protein